MAERPSSTNRLAALALRSERLLLTSLRPEDAEELRVLTDTPLITESISFLPTPFLLDDARALIRDHSSERECLFGIRTHQNGQLVGVIGAHLQPPSDLEIGYWIGVDFQRRGFALEAASTLVGVVKKTFPGCRIVAECRPGNTASWRVLERIGFTPTGEAGERPGRQRLVVS